MVSRFAMGTWRVWRSAVDDIKVAVRGYHRALPYLRAQSPSAARLAEPPRKRRFQAVPDGPWHPQC